MKDMIPEIIKELIYLLGLGIILPIIIFTLMGEGSYLIGVFKAIVEIIQEMK